ncbi:MAG: hypothetical protein HY290_21460 [Planctomycetia bacterium]|nr:hypothetical protein [Planctomycetia bacterium]
MRCNAGISSICENLRNLWIILFLVPACWALPVAASEPDDVPVPESAEEKPAPEKPAAGTATDDELQKSLAADARKFLEEAHERLQSAFDGMQAARRRIADDDTGSETQKTQELVVNELEELLKLVRQQQQRRGQSGSQSNPPPEGSQNPSRPERQKLPPGQNDPQNSGDKNNKDGDGHRNDKKSRDSQERSDAAREPTAEQARHRQAIKDVWGHLPPHVREAMLNSISEKYLPRYEELVKKYYESLAEKNRKQGGK